MLVPLNPKISVIIATYYRNDLVRDAIESVLDQDYEPIELIVVDDSGEGHAEPVLDEYDEIQPIIRETNGDWAAAYTTGIEAGSGEYFQFLDDDDYLLPGKLAKTAEVLSADPEVGVAFCGVEEEGVGAVRPDPGLRGDILERALRFRTYPVCTISMLMEREVLEDTLPFATYADDHDLKIELAKRTKFDYVDECLVYRRVLEDRKWSGWNRIREMKAVLEHQRDVYEQYPEIHRATLAHTLTQEGNLRLEEQLWSPRAIACFAKAAFLTTEYRSFYVGRLLGSFFGRPGMSLARKCSSVRLH